MAARAALFAAALALALTAAGVAGMELQPSAQRLVVTAVTALLLPLFWPGIGTRRAQTLWRIPTASLAAALLAGLVLKGLGGARQPFAELGLACGMLVLVESATLSLAAIVEWRLEQSGKATLAQESRSPQAQAGFAAALILALVGGSPLWLGPLAEILGRSHPWLIDLLVAISPLTHLAIASGNDLLRNAWLYDHANLAAVAVSYPALDSLLLGYVSAGLASAALLFAATARGHENASADDPSNDLHHANYPTYPTAEDPAP